MFDVSSLTDQFDVSQCDVNGLAGARNVDRMGHQPSLADSAQTSFPIEHGVTDEMDLDALKRLFA